MFLKFDFNLKTYLKSNVLYHHMLTPSYNHSIIKKILDKIIKSIYLLILLIIINNIKSEVCMYGEDEYQ